MINSDKAARDLDSALIEDLKNEKSMEVTIKTDATKDEELQGKVFFIAPSATNTSSGMGGVATSSNNATFKVKTEILSQNDRLRLGMNAKLNIIIDKSENALVVPYDAIVEKEDGKKVITLLKDNDEKEEVEVTLGIESGYYTEIKENDKLNEGMKIILPNIETGSTLDELLNTMSATGGI